MKALFARIPEALYNRIVRLAKTKDLKLSAVVKQALELWILEQNKDSL